MKQKIKCIVCLSFFCVATSITVRAQQSLTPSGLHSGFEFGKAVAIEEPFVFVGQPKTAISTSSGGYYIGPGRVMVYNTSSGSAVVDADLRPDVTLGYYEFGTSLAVSSNNLAVGAPHASTTTNGYCGAVYIFHYDGHQWSQIAVLVPVDGSSYIKFGEKVGMLDDWLFVGAPGQSTGGVGDAGRVYVYHCDDHNQYTLTQILTRTTPYSGDEFGFELTANGDTLAVAGRHTPKQVDIFTLNANVWEHDGNIISPDDYYYHNFGESLALYGDRLLIGTSSTRIYVYERSGGVWSDKAHLSGPPDPYMGDADGLSLNNQYALIMGNSFGYLCQPVGTNWNLLSTYYLPSEDDGGGRTCALSEDHFILGAPFAGGVASHTGTAYLYDMSALPPGFPFAPDPTSWNPMFTMPTSLSWSNGFGTTSVTVYLDTNNPPVQRILTNALAVENVTLPTLLYDTSYYWKVSDINANGTSTGPVWSFVSPQSPPSFGVSPATISFGGVQVNTISDAKAFSITNNGQKYLHGVVYVNPSYALTRIENGSGFQVHYASGQSVSYAVGNRRSVDFLVQFTPFQAGNNDGHIRITSNDSSNPTNFIMLYATGTLPAPPPPSLKKPADGATNQPVINARLYWSNGENTTMNSLHFGTNSVEQPLVLDHVAAVQGYNAGRLDWGQTYYWYVTSLNDDGGASGPLWSFTTRTEPKSIQVLSPNGGERWAIGFSHEIIWATGDVENVSIELLHNYGSGYVVYKTIASDTPNDGSYDWTPMATVSSGPYRIRITSTDDPAKTDDSDADFNVTTGLAVTVTSPNGGETWPLGSTHAITWVSSGISSNVDIDLYTTINGYTQYENIVAANIPNSGSYNWTVPTTERVDGHYLVYISSVDNPDVADFSDALFSLTAQKTIIIATPVPDARWSKESTKLIQWNTIGTVPHVDITLYRGGVEISEIVKNTANTNVYSWDIPASIVTGTNYQVKIEGYEDNSVSDMSAAFSIMPKAGSINVQIPKEGTRHDTGSHTSVEWTDTDVIGPMTMELWSGGKYVATIVSNLTDTGDFNWDIAAGLPTNQISQVCIVDESNPDTFGFSPIFDLEKPAYLKVTSPNGGESWQIGQNHSITWDSSNLSDNVQIDLYEESRFSETITRLIPNTGSYTWSASHEYPGDIYRIRISDIAHTEITDSSDADFALTEPLPVAPHDPRPGDNATNVWATVTFYAQLGDYADGCDIYLGKDNPPTTMILTNVPSASFLASNLDQLETYYWQVVARNSAGTTPGPIWKITTRREPLLISGLHRESGGIRVEWVSVGKVSRYHLLGTDSLTNGFHEISSSITNEILDIGNTNASHYFYRIIADPKP